jgi:hypothetical protein
MASPLASSRLLVLATAGLLLLGGCAAAPAPSPTPTDYAGGSGEAPEPATGSSSSEAPAAANSGLVQASADGMPALGIRECPVLDEYTYSPTSGNTVWHFVYTCTSRDAFDATTAELVASGYDLTPLVISEGNTVSERNHLRADATGGDTQVQLNLVGHPGELEFEIYVTLTLP